MGRWPRQLQPHGFVATRAGNLEVRRASLCTWNLAVQLGHALRTFHRNQRNHRRYCSNRPNVQLLSSIGLGECSVRRVPFERQHVKTLPCSAIAAISTTGTSDVECSISSAMTLAVDRWPSFRRAFTAASRASVIWPTHFQNGFLHEFHHAASIAHPLPPDGRAPRRLTLPASPERAGREPDGPNRLLSRSGAGGVTRRAGAQRRRRAAKRRRGRPRSHPSVRRPRQRRELQCDPHP